MFPTSFVAGRYLTIACAMAGMAGMAEASTFGFKTTRPFLSGNFEAAGDTCSGEVEAGVLDSFDPAGTAGGSPLSYSLVVDLCDPGNIFGDMNAFNDAFPDFLFGSLVDYAFDSETALSLLFETGGDETGAFQNGFVVELVASSVDGFAQGFKASGDIKVSAIETSAPIPLPAGLALGSSGILVLAAFGLARRRIA